MSNNDRMTERIVPMIHVPDVKATAEWYQAIGFEIRELGRECDEGDVIWALLRIGDSAIMLSSGGQPSDAFRREFDLYIHADNIDGRYAGLKDRVDIVEPPHDTFYGAREFILRDCNRFWITFAEPAKS